MKDRTTCVITGAGPAGALLALLLARAGVEVTLLEKHGDFLRDFRGDTVHPSTLQVLDELGMSADFERLPHTKSPYIGESQDGRNVVPKSDFRYLPGKYRYIAMVPQWDLLNLVVSRAQELPNFHLAMRTEVYDVIREGKAVRGVRYRSPDGAGEIRADLTVAADGRDSSVRRAAVLRPVELGAPLDIVWFRLPRAEDDPDATFLRPGHGTVMVLVNRGAYWQIAYTVPKGGYDRLLREGIGALRDSVAELVPFLGDRVRDIASFEDVKELSISVNRLRRWYRPGLLTIGDAAHAMSPIGGVGINLAVQDAVAAANLLATPLRDSQERGTGHVATSSLARFQLRRWFPAAATQFLQLRIQSRVSSRVRTPERGVATSASAGRMPQGARRAAGRIIGLGFLPEHVRTPDVVSGES